MNFDLPRLVDVVIALTATEFCVLAFYRRSQPGTSGKRGGIPLRDFAANMVSGLCLMLALRCMATEAGTQWTVLWLAAAGLAHATDIVGRLRRDRVEQPLEWNKAKT